MNLWQKCSLKLLTSDSVSDLPFSGNILQQPGLFPLHPRVWAGCSSAHDWDSRWHHRLCSLQSGFVIVTETLSLSLPLPLSKPFLFPQQPAEVSKTVPEPADFQTNGDYTSQDWTICRKLYHQMRKYLLFPMYWMSVGTSLHVYMNQQLVSLACHRDWKQTVFTHAK